LPLLYFLRFDFNPLNLRNPKVESVATFLELKRDPDTGINAIQILAPSLSDADAVAKRVAKLPEVSRTMTLSDFVPEQQDEKLALIRKASATLGPTINPQRTKPAPSDAGGSAPRLGDARWPRPRRSLAQGRPQRQRDPAQIRHRGACRRADRHGRAGLASGIRTHRRSRLHRSRILGARLDLDPAVD